MNGCHSNLPPSPRCVPCAAPGGSIVAECCYCVVSTHHRGMSWQVNAECDCPKCKLAEASKAKKASEAEQHTYACRASRDALSRAHSTASARARSNLSRSGGEEEEGVLLVICERLSESRVRRRAGARTTARTRRVRHGELCLQHGPFDCRWMSEGSGFAAGAQRTWCCCWALRLLRSAQWE